MDKQHIERVAKAIVDAAYKIHRRFGCALLENAYRRLLAAYLSRDGFKVEREKPVHLDYDGIVVLDAYRLDLLVDDLVVVEVKAVPVMRPEFERQILTYLEFAEKPLGFLINFGGLFIKDGINRYKNGYW